MNDADALEPRSPVASRTELAELVMPHLSNMSGYLHGGELLSRIDKAAAVSAMRHALGYCVTAAVDEVSFHQSIKIGELVRLVATVNYVGRSSMEVGVEVYAENPQIGTVRHTNSCFVTMVAVDDKGRPKRIPPLDIGSEDEQRRFDEGRARAMARKERRARSR
jgi:acyl-CoA hydrolase